MPESGPLWDTGEVSGLEPSLPALHRPLTDRATSHDDSRADEPSNVQWRKAMAYTATAVAVKATSLGWQGFNRGSDMMRCSSSRIAPRRLSRPAHPIQRPRVARTSLGPPAEGGGARTTRRTVPSRIRRPVGGGLDGSSPSRGGAIRAAEALGRRHATECPAAGIVRHTSSGDCGHRRQQTQVMPTIARTTAPLCWTAGAAVRPSLVRLTPVRSEAPRSLG